MFEIGKNEIDRDRQLVALRAELATLRGVGPRRQELLSLISAVVNYQPGTCRRVER